MTKAFAVAKALVVNDQGEVLTIRRSQSDERRPGEWDFPGGWVDDGEDIRAAVLREIQEEVGLIVQDPQLVFAVSEMTTQHGSGTWLLFVVHVTGKPAVTLSYEHDASDWKKPADLLKEITYQRQQNMLRYVLDNNLLQA